MRAVTRTGCPRGLCLLSTDQRPSDIQNYTGLRDTPLILGAVLALLAVLKTLGLLRSQLLRVVSWQASALATTALLVGLPVGLLAGRRAWALFAGSVGVAGTAEVPLPIVLLVIPVTLLLASLLAAGPGWQPPGSAPRRPCGRNEPRRGGRPDGPRGHCRRRLTLIWKLRRPDAATPQRWNSRQQAAAPQRWSRPGPPRGQAGACAGAARRGRAGSGAGGACP